VTLPANAQTNENGSAEQGGGSIIPPYRVTQFFVLLASLLCIALFRWVGNSLNVPAERGFDASVLRQPHWPMVLLAIYATFAICLIFGTLISGRWWFFGGLFATLVGLAVLSVRGGPMRYVLFDAQSAGLTQRVFLTLALETALLFVPIAMAWTYLWPRFESLLPALDTTKTPSDEMPLPLAVLAQVGITGVIVLLLAAIDSKKQVLVSVFLAGMIGTALADYIAPHRQAARWYWVGPLAVGVIGYLFAYFNATSWTNGAPLGAFAALARPLPLDYASAGAAGALLGYWAAADRPRVKFGWASPTHRGEQAGVGTETNSKFPAV
jgi:hypothetical protein